MSLAPRLDLRQSQSLVMTPQLQQAIRLLALSNLELEGFLAEEVEKNPLLDNQGSGDEGGPAPPAAEPMAATVNDEGGEPALPEIDASDGEAALDLDQNGEDFHQ